MSESFHQPPLWKIWANPIFQRYARSRLRPATLIPWILVVLVAAAFAFFVVYLFDLNRGRSHAAAAADTFFPVLVIQGVILLLMGTGSVASGITREADDGMVEYQRLTPMTPLAKIVGYLFGLPVREYLLFACTLPFTVFAVVAGGLSVGSVVEIYFVLFISAVLYHLTGCVAGTVVKRRRFAGRLAQMMVILLYFVLPGLSEFGFVFFEYLTMRPVLFEQLSSANMPIFRWMFRELAGIPSVMLFTIEFSQLAFSLLIQGSLIIAFVVVLFRKWRQPTNHLLGKNFAVFIYLWVMLLFLGNALPLIENGSIFPSRGDFVAERLDRAHGHVRSARAIEAYVLSGMFGFGALMLGFGIISTITPTSDEYRKGLLRARKLELRRMPLRADGSTGIYHTLALAAAGAIVWSYFVTAIFDSPHVQHIDYREGFLKLIPATLALYMLCYHGILERFGRRTLLLFTLFLWIVPLLGAIILLAGGFKGFPTLLASVSAFASPFYTLVLPVLDAELLGDNGRVMRAGILFSLLGHFMLALFLIWSLSKHKARIRQGVDG